MAWRMWLSWSLNGLVKLPPPALDRIYANVCELVPKNHSPFSLGFLFLCDPRKKIGIRLFRRGACPCSVNKTCVDPNQSCNCDVKENKWNSDEGYYQDPHSLGITNMYFLQQKDLDDEAQGRITLGPLECVETSEF